MFPANSKRNIIPTNSDIKNAKPKRSKRTGLTDLSNAISRTLHISSSVADDDNKKPEKEQVVVVVRKPEFEEHSIPERDNEKVSDSANKENENPLDGKEELSVVTLLDDPCPDYDYDANNHGDIFQAPEYTMDIFRYLRHRESFYHIIDYAPQHPQFKKVRRAKVVDWFVQCQEGFEINHEVLYLAVKLFDHYLCVTKNEQQFDYLGAASLVVASKTDQQDPLMVDDFINLTSPDRLKLVNHFERNILNVLGGDINYPISYRFLRRFSRAGGIDMRTLTLARYVLETSLLFYEFICVSDSLMAAATLLLALRMLNVGDWSNKLIKYSGYKLEDVEPLMWRLNHMMKMRPKVYPTCITIEQKYSHGIFYHSAAIPLLPDKRPRNEVVGPPPYLDFNAAGSTFEKK